MNKGAKSHCSRPFRLYLSLTPAAQHKSLALYILSPSMTFPTKPPLLHIFMSLIYAILPALCLLPTSRFLFVSPKLSYTILLEMIMYLVLAFVFVRTRWTNPRCFVVFDGCNIAETGLYLGACGSEFGQFLVAACARAEMANAAPNNTGLVGRDRTEPYDTRDPAEADAALQYYQQP